MRAGIVLGIGLGGFLDGILFHQILGWHHVICTTTTCQAISVEHLKVQNAQDGMFHLAVWTITVFGSALVYRGARQSVPRHSGFGLVGASLIGWGFFNFFEGIVNHQILGIHHVRPGHPNQGLFDLLFLASGLFLMILGALLAVFAPRGKNPA